MKKKHLSLIIVGSTMLLFLAVSVIVARSTAMMMENEARRTVRNIVDATV